MQHTRRFMKGAISLLLSRSTKELKKKKFTDSFWVNSDKSKERQQELGHYTF